MQWLNRVMLRLLTGNILDRRSLVKTVKLREIAELKTGPFGTQFSAKEYVSEGIPVINVKNIGYGNIISEGLVYVGINTLERLSEHKLKTGDIVFGRKGSVDRHCLITEKQDGWMQGSDCIRVRLTDASVYPNFISYYLLTDVVKAKINNSAVGSTMASLNTDILGDIDIRLPNCEEQYKIATALATIDQKIEANNKINDYLYQQLQLLYDYWFTQFNFPDNHGQPYKASNGLMVWNAKINHLIPADWQVKPMDTICSFRNGINYDKNIEGDTILLMYETSHHLRFFLTKVVLIRYVFHSNKVINTVCLIRALLLPVVEYQGPQGYYAIQVVMLFFVDLLFAAPHMIIPYETI